MRNHLKALVPAFILLIGCVLVWDARSQVSAQLAAPLTSVLPEMQGFVTANQTISPEEKRVAGMTDYVARSYRRDGAVIFTTLVSYYDRQTQGKSIHSPRNCLPGAGWEIVSGETRVIDASAAKSRVNRYVLKNGGATAIAYYWYQGRGRVTANEYAVKWNLLRDAALFGRTEEALVRIVLPVSGENTARLLRGETLPEDALAQQIASRLMSDVTGVLPVSGT